MKSKSVVQSVTDIFNNDTKRKEDVKDYVTEASFETAISATGFGKLAISIPCGWSALMDTTTMSYVLPAAHCDLEMSLEQRGLLNAIVYLGMISSGLVWGFLIDTLGRKRILVVGYLLDGICVLIAGFSQSYTMLVTAKFFTGFIITGPFTALPTVVSEFHCAKYRTRLVLGLGAVYSLAQLIIPILAWIVIPRNMDVELLDGHLKLHSWNFFIIICAFPSLASSFAHIFVPESPKFLMTVGRNDQALKIFKKVYSLNTGLHPDTFPIKSLVDESQFYSGGKHGGAVTANRSKTQALKEGWQQIAPIFFPPLILKLLLASTIQFGFVLGANTIRLWLPQIFTVMNDYQMLHPEEPASLCTMLELINPTDNTTATECVVNTVSDFVYINAITVASSAVIGHCVVSAVINKFGKKTIMIFLGSVSGVATACISFSQNSATTVVLAAINHTFMGICSIIEIAVVVDIFPTSLRAIAISIMMMIGRSGAMIGNVVFPYLLQLGCMPPFVLIGCVIFSCTLLALLLPKTDLKSLE